MWFCNDLICVCCWAIPYLYIWFCIQECTCCIQVFPAYLLSLYHMSPIHWIEPFPHVFTVTSRSWYIMHLSVCTVGTKVTSSSTTIRSWLLYISSPLCWICSCSFCCCLHLIIIFAQSYLCLTTSATSSSVVSHATIALLEMIFANLQFQQYKNVVYIIAVHLMCHAIITQCLKATLILATEDVNL